MPRTLRNVSCWPANEASGRSSAVALDRTAKVAAVSPATSSSYAALMSSSTSCGRGWVTIASRTRRPTSASCITSSVSRSAICPTMVWASPSWAMNRR